MLKNSKKILFGDETAEHERLEGVRSVESRLTVLEAIELRKRLAKRTSSANLWRDGELVRPDGPDVQSDGALQRSTGAKWVRINNNILLDRALIT